MTEKELDRIIYRLREVMARYPWDLASDDDVLTTKEMRHVVGTVLVAAMEVRDEWLRLATR
jgi:hypothetical protein